MITVRQIREAFIAYFESKGHLVIPSASLLPAGDPTLLFTTAGMVPFKDYFSGAAEPPSPRLASIQKCLRTTDLESVGKTQRHLSFFEMLGNFSFGDYFKKEAIEFAWELSTQALPFDPVTIWISVYESDDEAYDIWHKHIGIPRERIVRLGKKDNFWGPAGDTGACGPCSELYLDRGEAYGTGPENMAPGGDGDRFMEFWNLVFNQFNFNGREFLPLPRTGIDTGAGLERLATLLQNTDSVYDTDELMHLRDAIAAAYMSKYKGDSVVPIRVLTDHLRTLCFAIADGILPSNESRGYVLRRVLRRALLFGRRLGQRNPLLHTLVPTVIELYAEAYPALKVAQPLISQTIESEESRFIMTLDAGASRLEEVLERAAGGKVSGKDAFQLYDTYGFPLEMTVEMAELRGLSVDRKGFDSEMEAQRARGRSAWKGQAASFPVRDGETVYQGENSEQTTSPILYLVSGDKLVPTADGGTETVAVITRETVFYAEGGGQTGDTGSIRTPSGSGTVVDTQKQGKLIVHLVQNITGQLQAGETAELVIDNQRRDKLRRNHSATHLLNAALRAELGPHIRQTGSLVHADYLRFDFSHPAALEAGQIAAVEKRVNDVIRQSIAVTTEELPRDLAEKKGAVMTFGEKYGEVVRIVDIPGASMEFCGGSHVRNTSDIGAFIITKEASPGAGNRRIEALTGDRALDTIRDLITGLAEEASGNQDFAGRLMAVREQFNKGLISDCWNQLRSLQADIHEFLRQRKKDEKKNQDSLPAETLEAIRSAGIHTGRGILISGEIPDTPVATLKNAALLLADREPMAVVVLVSAHADRWNLVIARARNSVLTDTSAAACISEINAQLGSRGGGKPESAQASGQGDTGAVLELACRLVRDQLGS